MAYGFRNDMILEKTEELLQPHQLYKENALISCITENQISHGEVLKGKKEKEECILINEQVSYMNWKWNTPAQFPIALMLPTPPGAARCVSFSTTRLIGFKPPCHNDNNIRLMVENWSTCYSSNSISIQQENTMIKVLRKENVKNKSSTGSRNFYKCQTNYTWI